MLGLINNEQQNTAPAADAPKPETEKTGLDGYLDYLGIPKQEYAAEPEAEPAANSPFPEDADNEPPEDNTRPNGFNPDSYYEPSEIKTMENNIEFSMIPAESIVEVVDIGMVKGAELIAKEPQEGATDDEKAKLTKIWAMFLAGKNANITPGWMLLAMIVLIYAPKFYGAYQIRKAKQEAEQAREEARRAKARAKKAEAEAARLRRQQEIQDAVRASMQRQPEPNKEYVIWEDVDSAEDITATAVPVAPSAPDAPTAVNITGTTATTAPTGVTASKGSVNPKPSPKRKYTKHDPS